MAGAPAWQDTCREYRLLRTVAAGDGDRSLSALTRYYNSEGTRPGRWMGSGPRGLASGALAEGDQVSEAQLQLLVGPWPGYG